MDPEAEVTERANYKAIAANRVAAEASAEIMVRVEAKAEVRDRDVGILTEILKKVEAVSNGLNRVMVVAKEETKDKAERSREELEAEEGSVKE